MAVDLLAPVPGQAPKFDLTEGDSELLGKVGQMSLANKYRGVTSIPDGSCHIRSAYEETSRRCRERLDPGLN